MLFSPLDIQALHISLMRSRTRVCEGKWIEPLDDHFFIIYVLLLLGSSSFPSSVHQRCHLRDSPDTMRPQRRASITSQIPSAAGIWRGPTQQVCFDSTHVWSAAGSSRRQFSSASKALSPQIQLMLKYYNIGITILLFVCCPVCISPDTSVHHQAKQLGPSSKIIATS